MAVFGRSSNLGFRRQVSGGRLQLTIVPPAPQIDNTWPLGAKVAGLIATWTSGVPFGGGFVFVAPNFDAGGVFAITVNADFTGNLIINPSGPGVSGISGTVTDHVTIEAYQ